MPHRARTSDCTHGHRGRRTLLPWPCRAPRARAGAGLWRTRWPSIGRRRRRACSRSTRPTYSPHARGGARRARERQAARADAGSGRRQGEADESDSDQSLDGSLQTSAWVPASAKLSRGGGLPAHPSKAGADAQDVTPPQLCGLCGGPFAGRAADAQEAPDAVAWLCSCYIAPTFVHARCAGNRCGGGGNAGRSVTVCSSVGARAARCLACGQSNQAALVARARDSLSVVVIGGGPAGLAAARALAIGGARSVTVLEARERLGGRVFSSTLSNGEVVDLGASFIHGCSVYNSVYRAAASLGALVDRREGGYSRAWSERCAFYDTSRGATPGARAQPRAVGRAFELLRRVRVLLEAYVAKLAAALAHGLPPPPLPLPRKRPERGRAGKAAEVGAAKAEETPRAAERPQRGVRLPLPPPLPLAERGR
ncbi:hypothetical protein T492DRAFT_848061 [Pavlovales sp. CCMP2436]|nr:hypothetical protein T492DRAFT_848061 [Pavlovales sp. CCMP2436]